MGLPLSIAFSKKGFQVIGFDIDEDRISNLKEGINYTKEILSSDFLEAKSLCIALTNELHYNYDAVVLAVRHDDFKTIDYTGFKASR